VFERLAAGTSAGVTDWVGECPTLDLAAKTIVERLSAWQPFGDGQPQEERVQSPIDVVRRFCTAWSENGTAHELAEFFTDDAVYHNIPLKPVAGKDAIENTIATFIRPGRPGIESIDFRVINIAANGPVVMTERVDVFMLPGRSFELPVMGTFEISDGKIKAWRDYFDINQFTTLMG
jgi:limonene-1,2-epoxide hydrolase